MSVLRPDHPWIHLTVDAKEPWRRQLQGVLLEAVAEAEVFFQNFRRLWILPTRTVKDKLPLLNDALQHVDRVMPEANLRCYNRVASHSTVTVYQRPKPKFLFKREPGLLDLFLANALLLVAVSYAPPFL